VIKAFKTNSIIVLFLAYIVPVFLLVNLFFLSITTFRTQHEIHRGLDRKMQSIFDMENDIIAHTLWNVNAKRTKQILTSIMTDPDVLGISVFDENKAPFCNIGGLKDLSYEQVDRLFAKGFYHLGKKNILLQILNVIVSGEKEHDHKTHHHGKKNIFFKTDAGTEFTGTFFICLSSDSKNVWFRNRLKQDVLWMAILLLFVILGATMAYWRTILVPLNILLGGIHAAKRKRFKEITGYQGESEIDLVIQTFNELQKKQNEYQRYLEDEKDRLEEKISLRTRDLRESQEKYKNLVESTNEWIWETDSHAVFTYSSPQSFEITGFTPEEIQGKSFFDLVSPEEAKRLAGILDNHQISTIPFEKINQHKNGNLMISETSIMTIFNTQGNIQGYRGIDRDITERKKIERLVQIQRDLGTSLGLADSLTDALNVCLKSILKIGHFDCGGFYMVHAETGDIDLIAHKNLPEGWIHETAHFDAASPQNEVIMQGSPIYESYDALINRIDMTHVQKKQRMKYGFQSIAIIPILHEQKVIAAMNIVSTTSPLITEFDQYALEAIAVQIAGLLAKIKVDQALTESRINFRTLFDNLNDFLFVLNASGDIIEYNAVVQNRLGYTKQELKQMNVLDLHPPGKREEAAKIIKLMLEGRVNSCSIPLRTKNGNLIPVSTKITRGTWDNKDAVFGISRDITDIKKNEAQIHKNLKEKEALLREIHHRVKNNMQVISSLLSIQSDEIKDKKVLDIFTKAEVRVQSMAFVHELLYQSENFSEISFQIYLENLADHLLQVYATSDASAGIEIRAQDVFLMVEQAVPCGMIITELITNSLKYARPKAVLTISITVTCDGHDGIVMKIADNGIAPHVPIDLEHIPSLGLRLVTELITDQLEGTYTVEQDNGVCWTIRWPANQQK